jgi:hypothetical protein
LFPFYYLCWSVCLLVFPLELHYLTSTHFCLPEPQFLPLQLSETACYASELLLLHSKVEYASTKNTSVTINLPHSFPFP